MRHIFDVKGQGVVYTTNIFVGYGSGANPLEDLQSTASNTRPHYPIIFIFEMVGWGRLFVGGKILGFVVIRQGK